MGSVFKLRNSFAVLVVDDDPDILNLLRTPLEREGYQVFLAEDGAGALAYLRDHHVDLILSDVDMPSMDGYELVVKVKESVKTAEIPFLFFSAHDEVGDRIKGLELGANDYISKPFVPKEVCLRVRNVLEQQTNKEKRVAQTMVAALDLVQLGIAVLGNRGEIRMTNSTADEILKQKDGLTLRDHRLCGKTIADTRRIEKMLEEASTLVSSFNPEKVNPIRLPRPSLKRDFSLIALPLDMGYADAPDHHRVVGIIIHDPETTNIPSPKLLSDVYHFTKAEARVAALLIQGKAINEICASLAVSRNTVCTHIKKLYMKTDTQRQSDFTRFLLSGLSQLRLG